MPDVNFRVVARLKGHLLLRHPRKIQKCLVRQIGAEYLRGHPGQENCFFFGLTKGEFEIREIYAYANASLVTYSKAAKFKVIREEIPCFNASFSAESAAKQLGLKEEGGTE